MYFKRLEGITPKYLYENGHIMHVLHSLGKENHPYPHTYTHTLFNTKCIVFPPCSFFCILILLNSSTSNHHPHQKPGSHFGLTSHHHGWACRRHQLLAQPSVWPAPLPQSPEAGQPSPLTKTKAWLTFGVQEVKGSSNIPYHSAGFSLIEVLLLLDVGQDGTWEQRGHRGMPFQALLSITSQRPSFYRFGGGDIGLFMTKCPEPSVAPGTQEVPAQNWSEKNWTIFYTCLWWVQRRVRTTI